MNVEKTSIINQNTENNSTLIKSKSKKELSKIKLINQQHEQIISQKYDVNKNTIAQSPANLKNQPINKRTRSKSNIKEKSMDSNTYEPTKPENIEKNDIRKTNQYPLRTKKTKINNKSDNKSQDKTSVSDNASNNDMSDVNTPDKSFNIQKKDKVIRKRNKSKPDGRKTI